LTVQTVPTIGQFNRPVIVKAIQTSQNSAGDTINAGFVTVFSTMAAMDPVSSKTMYLQGLESLENTLKIWIRATTDRTVTMANIIEYEGQDFVIIAITEVKENNKRFLQLLIKERSQKG